MRIAKISITNVLGIDHLEFSPGAFTSIEGGNNTGKSSTLEAIKGLFKGGYDASLIRKGQKSGEVVLVLDDGRTFRSLTTERGSYLTDANKKPVRRSELDALVDSLSLNPIDFLMAPPDKQAEWLLEVMPIDVTDAELSEAAGFEAHGSGLNGLEAIARARKQVYDQRTQANSDYKKSSATVEQLTATLPKESLTDVKGAYAVAQAKVREIDQAIDSRKDIVKTALDDDIGNIRKASAGIIADLEKQIAALTAQIRAEQAKETAEIQKAKDLANKLYGDFRDQKAVERATAQAELARLQQLSDEHERAENTRDIIAQMELEARLEKTHSEALTAALERLDALKASKLASLPIPGMEIEPGQVWYDAGDGNGRIQFNRLNGAKQVQLSLKVARLRARDCKLVLVDGIERLDPEMFAAFEKAAVASDFQFICTRVGSGPRTIRTLPEQGKLV